MNVTLVPAQMVVADAEIETAGVTVGLTVIVSELEVAVSGDAQLSDEVITQLTTFPLVSVVVVYVGLLVPVLTPFNFHWYEGLDPPLVGVAVNVTEVPAHIVVPGEAVMLTAGVLLPEGRS